MVYHPVRLALTHPQIKKVMTGGNVQVAHHKMGHGHVFHLTTAQHNKMARHHAAGKGVRMHFDHAQIRHHLRHGKGFFDSILNVGKSLLQSVARPLAGKAIDALAGKAGPLGGIVRGIANAGLNAAGNKLGFGMKKRRRRVGCGRRRRRRHAGGSFHTIGRGDYDGGSFAPIGH